MHSKIYDNNAIWVACCECQRGGNGEAIDKCSAGFQSTAWDKLGCWSGELQPAQVNQIIGPVLKWSGVQDDDVWRWHQANDRIDRGESHGDQH